MSRSRPTIKELTKEIHFYQNLIVTLIILITLGIGLGGLAGYNIHRTKYFSNKYKQQDILGQQYAYYTPRYKVDAGLQSVLDPIKDYQILDRKTYITDQNNKKEFNVVMVYEVKEVPYGSLSIKPPSNNTPIYDNVIMDDTDGILPKDPLVNSAIDSNVIDCSNNK